MRKAVERLSWMAQTVKAKLVRGAVTNQLAYETQCDLRGYADVLQTAL